MRTAKQPRFNPLDVRAHFVLRGQSLKQWSDANRFKHRHVYQIIHGLRSGNSAGGRVIIRALNRELGRKA